MSYSPGTVVYAKLKGYPWWPARVEVESSLPSHVRSKKPKTPKPTIGVRFFGSKDYGWLGSNDLKPFDKKDAEVTLQKMKQKVKSKKHEKLLERSIREALDPSSSSFDEPIDEEGADDDVESDSDVELEDESKKSSESYENDDEDEGEYTKKSKIRSKGIKKSKKTISIKSSDHRRTKSLSGKKKYRTYSSDDDDDDDVNYSGKGGKKRRASEEKISKRKQRKIDYTDDEEEKMELDDEKERRQTVKKDRSEGSKSPVKSDNESPEGDVNDRDENKHNKGNDAGSENKSSRIEYESHHRSSKSRQSKTPGDRLLHLRHKLQRMTLKEDNIESLDTEKIDEVFTEVENFPITIPLLKESKIGKLMRKIAEKIIDPDPKRIIERSNELVKKWKCLLEAPTHVTHEGSDEETSPKTVNQAEGESPSQEIVNDEEESNRPLPGEREIDNKKNEENVDSNSVKDNPKLPSAMDIDEINDIRPETGEIVESKDNIVANGSSLAANNQEVNSREKEDFKNKTSEL